MADKATVRAMQSGLDLSGSIDAPSEHQLIADFLFGRNDGEAVFQALYGDAADEPLPRHLSDVLRDWRVV